MNRFTLVPFAEFAQEVVRPVALRLGVTYQSVGVKWYGEGVHVHEVRDGGDFDAPRFEIRADDVIYNDMWARKGSVAVVPGVFSGSVASSHFPTFELDRARVEPRYLAWFFRTPSFWDACEGISRGSTGRNQIKRRTFLALQVPLPPAEEQSRIVARIDELVAQIDEALNLRRRASEDAEAICRSLLTHGSATLTPMRELMELRPPDVIVRRDETYQFAGVYSFGRGVFRGARKSGLDFAYPRLTRLRAGNFVYPKLMAWEGALGVVPPECDGCVVSTEFPVFAVREDRVFHEILDTYFRMPSVWPGLSQASTGTNVRRRRLNPQDFLDYQMPLPQRAAQVALRDIRRQVEGLNHLQAETAAELDALLPSVLSQAFAGEL